MSEGTQQASFRIYEGDGNGDVSHLLDALDQLSAASGVRELREWARSALAARPGERAVDVGSGTGEEVQALAEQVGPDGEAIGIEPLPGIRAAAVRRAEAAGSAARFVAGEAYPLPLDESTVDVVRCERVFQHLEQPERAAGEIARVLRPGGRVALLDSDWGTTIVHPGDPAIVQSLQRLALDRSANPFSGRRLAGQLAAVGLTVVQQTARALIRDSNAVDELLGIIGTTAVAAGVLTEDQWAGFEAELRSAAAVGDFHFSVTMFGVLARKM
jgi:ubiquinone/menaquinone biosynthesis C-methylase UbiE